MDDQPTLDVSTPIPYRAQETNWTCGAASLRMVYASLGLELTESEIWTSLKPNPQDRSGAESARLAWDAQRRGFAALAVRTRAPWTLIRTCAERGLRLIFQQPLAQGSPRRHFSVMAEADENGIGIHDPQFGASLRFRKADWLELWGTNFGNYRAAVNELVAVAEVASGVPTVCRACAAPIPEAVRCPVCREAVRLQPAEALACVAADCSERLWTQIVCPGCHHAIDEHGELQPVDPHASLLVPENRTMLNGSRFSKLSKAMEDYQRTLAQTQGASVDPGFREMLASLQQSLKDSTDQLVESLERIDEQHKAQAEQLAVKRAEAKQKLAQAKQAREEALAKLAAKKAASAARTPPAQAAADPHLGERLRDKLLEEFGTRVDRPPSTPADSLGSLLDFDPESP